MVHHICTTLLLIFCFISYFQYSSSQQCTDLKLPFKAVNIGHWLVTEGWMNSTFSNGIINKDLLDGTRVQFMSTKLQKYLSTELGGGRELVANQSVADTWETFRLWRVNDSYFNFRVSSKTFVGLANPGKANKIVSVSKTAGHWQTFQIIRNERDPNRVRIRAPNGMFLQAKSENLVTADFEGSGWEDDNPSVFRMNNLGGLQGEYQVTNGYGDKAAEFMRNHWDTYITEEDFKYMSEINLTAVRIPVGWWLAFDPTPPKPFVGGSLQMLDNAFEWAQKYGLKVIVDLHAIKDSQNGNPHSAARDGYIEWGAKSIPDTVFVIDFLAKRYANHPNLAAIALMNEPIAPFVTLENLKMYYKAGYDAVRKYSSCPYVIFSNRLGHTNKTELLSFATGLHRVAIDVHYYNYFLDFFKKMNLTENIHYLYYNKANELSTLTTPNGPLIFVGEWSSEWYVQNASMSDFQRYNKAQMDVYGHATFGWAFWAYRCEATHWSLEWMIKNKYMLQI